MRHEANHTAHAVLDHSDAAIQDPNNTQGINCLQNFPYYHVQAEVLHWNEPQLKKIIEWS